MKTKNSEDIMRIESMINNDRLNTNKEFERLFSKDIGSILNEYFLLNGLPKIAIEKKGKNITVSIIASINSVKTFSSVSEAD